jgi:hypothetical protein
MSLRSSRFRVLSVIPKRQANNQGIPLTVPTSVTTAFTTGVVMNGVEIESLGCQFLTPHTGLVVYGDEEYLVNFQPIR